MIGKTLYPLVPFDVLYSTDYGIIQFIKNCMESSHYLDLTLARSMNQKDILIALRRRTDVNPLTIIAYPDATSDSLNQLYQDIMSNNEYKKEITRLSPFTDIGYVIVVAGSKQLDGITPYILVRDQYEEEKIKNNKTISGTDIRVCHHSCIDLLEPIVSFDPYYVSTYTDLYHQDIRPIFYEKTLVGKHIFIADTTYNEIFVKNEDFLQGSGEPYGKISPANEFIAIDIWRKDKTDYE